MSSNSHTSPTSPPAVGPKFTPAALLKRSDAPHYRVYIGHDWEAMAATLSAQQAFVVHAMLICPISSVTAADSVNRAILAHCVPLHNNWFQAPSNDIASAILLQAMTSPPDSTDPETVPAEAADIGDSQEACADSSGDQEDRGVTALVDDALWTHVAPCTSEEASKAIDIRAALIQRLGKTATRKLLGHCTATVAKDSSGRKNRVLKAHGKLLRLKQ